MKKYIEELSEIYKKLYKISEDIYSSDEYNNEMVEKRIDIENNLERAQDNLKELISKFKPKLEN